MVEALIGVGCVLFLQLLAFTYGYGKLNQKVKGICNDTSHIWKEIEDVRESLVDIAKKLAHLEGKVEVKK